MKKSSQLKIARIKLLKIAVIAALMAVTYRPCEVYLGFLNIDPHISLFYIPAGIITLATLGSPKFGPIGIFFGALIAYQSPWSSVTIFEQITLASIPAFSALLAVAVLYSAKSKLSEMFHDNKLIMEIDGLDVFYFCCAYGFFNTGAHHLIYIINGNYAMTLSITKAIGMWFGDLTGSFLVFIGLNIAYSIWIRFHRILFPSQ